MSAGLLILCFSIPEPWLSGQSAVETGCHSEYPGPAELSPVFEGPFLSLYTTGRLLRQNRHAKSGVWNTPARMVREMWVKRAEAPTLHRLEPKTLRRQLLELLADFPEIHGAIRQPGFTYKNLPREIRNLNGHISKVITIRREKRSFRAR